MSEIKMLTPEKIITTIKNKKTGEVYETEEALKAANIPDEDVRRDVTVIMPPLDLIGKTKQYKIGKKIELQKVVLAQIGEGL